MLSACVRSTVAVCVCVMDLSNLLLSVSIRADRQRPWRRTWQVGLHLHLTRLLSEWVYLFRWIPAVTHTALLFACRHTVKHHCRVQIDIYFQHWVCRPVWTGWPQSWLLMFADSTEWLHFWSSECAWIQDNNILIQYEEFCWYFSCAHVRTGILWVRVCQSGGRDVEKYLFVFYCPLDWEQCVILAAR